MRLKELQESSLGLGANKAEEEEADSTPEIKTSDGQTNRSNVAKYQTR